MAEPCTSPKRITGYVPNKRINRRGTHPKKKKGIMKGLTETSDWVARNSSQETLEGETAGAGGEVRWHLLRVGGGKMAAEMEKK